MENPSGNRLVVTRTRNLRRRSRRKIRKTQTKGFPQENDFVEIDFGEERFEAVVLDAGATLIDIQYTVDSSCEFVDRNDWRLETWCF